MTKQLEALVANEIDRFRSGEISAAYLLHGWVCNFVDPNQVNRQPVLDMLTDRWEGDNFVTDDYTEHAIEWVRNNVPADMVGYAAILEAVGGVS